MVISASMVSVEKSEMNNLLILCESYTMSV